jgi:O-acetyl-ADP-ribose deacetylase (regulator of RNase III)
VIQIVLADITTLRVDAIVNAANPGLGGGGGVDGAIHRAAGSELARAATALAPCEPGRAVITPGFALPARFVIHAVGPVWRGGTNGEPEILRRSYESAFALAGAHDIRSIAFPAISTGAYGYPKAEAAAVALGAMRRHERELERIVVCVHDDESLRIYRRLHDEAPSA